VLIFSVKAAKMQLLKMQNFSHLAEFFSNICRQLGLGPGNSVALTGHSSTLLAIRKICSSLFNILRNRQSMYPFAQEIAVGYYV
jgi:hypothetical protein